MKPDTMRKIDAGLGPLLCAALTVRRRLLDLLLPRSTGRLEVVKRLLFVKPAEMGSTILMYPMLCRARQLWPDCEFHFLVFAENTAAVHMLGMVDEANIHTIRTTDLKTFVKDSLAALWKLRWLNFDAAFDLEFFSRASAILTELAGARATCGFNRFTMEGLYKGSFFTHPVQYNSHIHTAQTFLCMIDALDQPAGQVPLVKTPVKPLEQLELARLTCTPEERLQVRQLIGEHTTAMNGHSRFVILNANSSDLVPLRRWPLENFIELGRRLMQFENLVIVLTGVPGERAESEQVQAAIGSSRVANLVGRTSLRQLLVLYSLCDLMITNDSGPSHFASLTDLPVITLFGPETPRLYGALGKNKRAITAGLACSPCVSSYNHRATACNANICMRSITVEEVFKACSEFLI
ncbi:MAG TPA: glycosyltransferase family 9 protein [Candidatus Rifleibacterium sp.]|nr:glycosyltransferase family 9 protein [Candidatus Rifleibacterium sp.]